MDENANGTTDQSQEIEATPEQVQALLAGAEVDLSGVADKSSEAKPDEKTAETKTEEQRKDPAAEYKRLQVETLVNQFLDMPEEEQRRYVEVLQNKQPNQQTDSRISSISFDEVNAVPAAAIESFEKALGEDVSEEGKLMFKGLVQMNKNLQAAVSNLAGELQAIKSGVMPVMAQTQNARDAQALSAMGYKGVTEQTVAQLRSTGTQDVVGAYRLIHGAPKPVERDPKAIPEGMDRSSQKRLVVDIDKGDYTTEQIMDMVSKGVAIKGKNAHLLNALKK